MASIYDFLGMLNPGQNMNPASGMLTQQNPYQGLLNLSAGLLKASGPSPYKKGFGQVLGEAMEYSGDRQDRDLERQMKQAALVQQYQRGNELPSNVREYQYWNGLSPEEKENYLKVKRAEQLMNLGGNYVVRGPMGGISETYAKTPEPEQMPDFRAAQTKASEDAKKLSEAQANLPGAIQTGEQSLALIDQMVGNSEKKIPKHPGFKYAVGGTSVLPVLPGTDAKDFTTLLDQVQGKQFLQAYETLKGSGQITEIEGRKATDAIARMNRAQSEPEFIKAAREFQGVIKTGINRARLKAKQSPNQMGGLSSPVGTDPMPNVGDNDPFGIR